MTNTRILTNEFEYHDPKTVKEAVSLLAGCEGAKVLAGGSNLLVDMKMGKADPKHLIYIGKIPELRTISKAGADVIVGANMSFSDVMKSRELKDCAILMEALKSIQIEVKMMGTIGGNICNAAPTASASLPLLVLNAKVKTVSEKGSRTIPIEDVFTGNRCTCLSGGELLTEIHIPALASGYGAAFVELKRKIKFAVVLGRQGDTCNYCRIAIGGTVEMTHRVKKAESALEGKKFNDSALDAACVAALNEIDPDNWYVREVAKDLFQKVVKKAWERSR